MGGRCIMHYWMLLLMPMLMVALMMLLCGTNSRSSCSSLLSMLLFSPKSPTLETFLHGKPYTTSGTVRYVMDNMIFRFLPNQLSTTPEQHRPASSRSTDTPTRTTNTKTTTSNQRLNILLLYGDDWRHDTLGTIPTGNVDGVAGGTGTGTDVRSRTPFLDHLAQDEGIRFIHNYVTTSICWISRASCHTGQYFARHQAILPNTTSWYKNWNTTTFPGLLKQPRRQQQRPKKTIPTDNDDDHDNNNDGDDGYFVGHVGKWQFQNFAKVAPYYDFARIYSGQHWYYNYSTKHKKSSSSLSSTFDINTTIQNETTIRRHQGRIRRRGRKRRRLSPHKTIHAIDRNQQDALDFLRQRPKDRPFMLTVAFFPPHAVDGTTGQYFPQPKTMPLYDNVTLKVPTTLDMNESFTKLPSFFNENNEGRIRWHTRFDESVKYETMLKNYYRLVSGVDGACQMIVEELHRQGIWNNTLIIFTTDNGLYHGEHGLAGKWFPHQESIRTPLIIRDPRMPLSKRGTVDDSITLNVDLAPTILGAAQVPWQELSRGRMQGRDISDLYLHHHRDGTSDDDDDDEDDDDDDIYHHHKTNNSPPWRTDFFYEHPMLFGETRIPGSTALVRKDMKYIVWSDFTQEQLFNLTDDPNEEKDISSEPQYSFLLDTMRSRHAELQKWVK